MGNWIPRFRSHLTEAKVLILGLNNAGKTTVLTRLRGEEVRDVSPTAVINEATVSPVEGLQLTVHDVEGQDRTGQHWEKRYKDVDGLIFVLDSADGQRMSEARQELLGILAREDLRGVPLVVMANKQDLPAAFDASVISGQLQLPGLQDRAWFVHETCATSGQGVRDATIWLARAMKQRIQDLRDGVE